MKRIAVTAIITSVLGALALSAPASADRINRLAKDECRQELREEPGEFKAVYGGTGKAAIKRCARHQRRDARADCRGDRAEDPGEFALEYGGTDSAAMKRCVRDELR